MGIKSLFGFGQARDKPVDKAADAGYSFLFGRTTSGKPVNERTAKLCGDISEGSTAWGVSLAYRD